MLICYRAKTHKYMVKILLFYRVVQINVQALIARTTQQKLDYQVCLD